MHNKETLLKLADAGLIERSPIQLSYKIQKVDYDQQLVTGVVYSPWVLDSHGHYMTPAEVEKTCHAFLAAGRQTQVDVMHDNKVIRATVVESYIERIGNAEVPVGSWVASTKIEDAKIWRLIKDGKLNGYSMEIMAYTVEQQAEISFDAWVYGETQPDPFDGHTHFYLIKMDEQGNIEYGYTSHGGPDDHRHTISRMSVTDPYNYTTHRIVL